MRGVKLGRKALVGAPLAYHWAVKVGDTWYEIDGGKNNRNSVKRHKGSAAASSAGTFGGELVGETDATDNKIDDWIEGWLSRNPDYEALSANCQKFAYEFIDWLTHGNCVCSHRFNASSGRRHMSAASTYSFARAEGGNAIARISGDVAYASAGIASVSSRTQHMQVQAVAGPGLGVWFDSSTVRMEASLGNIVGAHFDSNINTGVGIRNGNLDAHLLGFGVKVGADGIEVNTPVVGVSACSVM